VSQRFCVTTSRRIYAEMPPPKLVRPMKIKSQASSGIEGFTRAPSSGRGSGGVLLSTGDVRVLLLVGYLLGEFLGGVLVTVGLDPVVGEVDPLGVLPVQFENLHEALDQVGIAEPDPEFPALVEALGINVKGTQEGAVRIGQNQLGVKMRSLEFVDVDA